VGPADDGLGIVVGGGANAVGETTLTTGGTVGKIVDIGPMKIGKGTAKFAAAAKSAPGDLAYATADTFATSKGADFSLAFTHTTTDPKGAAISEAKITAFNLENCRKAPLALHFDTHKVAPIKTGALSGNVSMLCANAKVDADNSFAEVDSNLLTVEDRFSGVDGLAVLAAS
jgi:hypothetical protein